MGYGPTSLYSLQYNRYNLGHLLYLWFIGGKECANSKDPVVDFAAKGAR